MRIIHPPSLSGTLYATPDGQRGSRFTVGIMRQMVNDAKTNTAIIETAQSLVGLTPQHNPRTEVETLFLFARDDVRYIRDVHGVETLTEPAYVLQRLSGDCDDKATLLGAMLESVGYPVRFILAGYTPGLREYEHVYLQALIDDEWITLDPSVEQPAGYEVPGAVLYWREPI